MNSNKHQDLLKEFVRLGGSERLAKSLATFSLQNFAKLKYEIGKLEPRTEKQEPRDKKQETGDKKQKPRAFTDLISEYPVELHLVYHRRWNAWLGACSLKVRLNELKPNETEKAFDIQMKIFQSFKTLDECEKILKHYREHKRIMPTESETDFEQMTELQIHKMQNNLRASITRRRQTIEKMQAHLPENPTPRELHSINLKKEQLQQKINDLLECEKFLNNGK